MLKKVKIQKQRKIWKQVRKNQQVVKPLTITKINEILK